MKKWHLEKTLHDFLKNFWRTAVEFCTFMFEGVRRSWQPLPQETHSSCMFCNVRRPIKIVVFFLTLDTCCSVVGHTYSTLGRQVAKANWPLSPAPKVFSEIAAPMFEKEHLNHHDVDHAKRLTDAIMALMCDDSLNSVTCERRPPMEKKNAPFAFSPFWCLV